MAGNRNFVSIDIGSHTIRTVVGILDENSSNPQILGVGIAPSEGIRKSMVVDIEEAIRSISLSLEDAERLSGEPINHVFVGMGGHHLESYNSKGVIAISNPNGEIMEDDIDRSLEAAQAVSIPNNRKILRIIPRSFTVDDQEGIKYPVGMTGIRLEVDAHIVTGMTPGVKNLEKVIFESGVDIDDVVPNGLAAAEAVLQRRQKELGVVVLDIGCGSTNMTVYEEGTILHSKVLPIGGESVTNDIAIGLKTSIESAEKIKIEYGTCKPEDIDSKEQIDLSLISKVDLHQVSRKTLAQIIQARYQEILELAKDELIAINRDGTLPAGVVITGGGSKMQGLIDLSRDTLKLPAQIGFPQNFEGVLEQVDDPSYSTAIGLLIWGSRFSDTQGSSLGFSSVDFSKVADTLKSWLKNLMP